jgi:hypothetical protein
MPVVKRFDACRQTLSDIGAADRDGYCARSGSRQRWWRLSAVGIVAEVSRREKVHVSTWNVAYQKRRFIVCHDDTYAS